MDANQSDAAVNLTRNSLGYGLRRGDQVAAQSDGEATADGNARAASSSLSLDQVFSASRVASVSFSAGFIWWLTRGGGLLTSMLMGVPAWRHIDLLPVLARNFDDEDEADGDRDGDEGKPLPKTAAHRTDGTNQAATKAAREAAATADIKVEALFEPRSAARPTLHRTPE